MFEMAMEFCEDILCKEMNIHYLYHKIKKSYIQIDYKSTLKLLVRAKLCAQLREDAYVLICKYLDFMEEYRNIEQLREENTSDQLIFVQLRKLKRHGGNLVQRMDQYLIDHTKVFREGRIWLGSYDIQE